MKRGEKIVEAERTAGAKIHGERKHCIVEKLRQAHVASALRTSTLHKVLMDIQEMNVRLQSATQSSIQGGRGDCSGACEVHTPSLVGSIARHRMHGAGHGAGRFFWAVYLCYHCCVMTF